MCRNCCKAHSYKGQLDCPAHNLKFASKRAKLEAEEAAPVDKPEGVVVAATAVAAE